MQPGKFLRVLLVLMVLLTTPALSAGVVVHDQDVYREAVENANPGDVIKLANDRVRKTMMLSASLFESSIWGNINS